MNVFSLVEYFIEYFIYQNKKDHNNLNIIELKILINYFFKTIFFYRKKRLNLNKKVLFLFNHILNKRKNMVPINYIIGKKEFYLRNFFINKSVLIPRYDTEFLIDIILSYIKKDDINLCDLGTGSCVLSIILKKNRPKWNFFVSDISIHSLQTSFNNANEILDKNISFFIGSWFSAFPKNLFGKIDVIVSNPPYINIIDLNQNIDNLKYEPVKSLYSRKNGFFCFQNIIYQSKKYLKKNGFIFLEHGLNQAKYIRKMLDRM